MRRVNAYAYSSLDGNSVLFDAEGMCCDLVTVLKAGGYTKEAWMEFASETFDAVEVEVMYAPQGVH